MRSLLGEEKHGAKFMRRCRNSIATQCLTAHLGKMLFIGHYSVFPRTRPGMQCKYCLIGKELIAALRGPSLNHTDLNIISNLSSLCALQPSFAFEKRLKLHNLKFKSMVAQKLNQLIPGFSFAFINCL